jgi:hypothetical protein
MMEDTKIKNHRHKFIDRKNDLYETPAVAVEALLRVENLPHRLWEPACGRGAIVDVLRDAGHEVLASDLVDYGNSSHFYRRDFLMEKLPKGCEGIITNPPFKLATQFVAHAITLCPLVIMLLRLAFLESTRRTSILEHRGLARVYVFRERLPMMHRDGWSGPRSTSTIPYAWFVWDQNYRNATTLHRISWKDT